MVDIANHAPNTKIKRNI